MTPVAIVYLQREPSPRGQAEGPPTSQARWAKLEWLSEPILFTSWPQAEPSLMWVLAAPRPDPAKQTMVPGVSSAGPALPLSGLQQQQVLPFGARIVICNDIALDLASCCLLLVSPRAGVTSILFTIPSTSHMPAHCQCLRFIK